MEKLVNIFTRKVLEDIDAELSKGHKRGFVSLRGLEEEELQAVARTLRGLGLRAGVAPNGVWWSVRAKTKTIKSG